ncbi:hypothetical protein L911_0432 [Vibrio fluvialis I21563]|nr:hypothetical protein L911_0432 [Vibrio fluvialis I21563]
MRFGHPRSTGGAEYPMRSHQCEGFDLQCNGIDPHQPQLFSFAFHNLNV